jgi:uncharacterized protein YjbI with pentapeptide repeats
MTAANLKGPNLIGANLFEVDLTVAKYTRTTKGPGRINLAKAGAILEP